ncbi:MAG TPA: site-2 protease family protein, partial [Planctomycetota bacterium]|nr:site-2 protease family protein [Planctomycetota bacterium]
GAAQGAWDFGWPGFVQGLGRAAILTGALLFVIVWHELGHAWAARRSRLRVDGIMLWILGGECRIVGGMPSPRTELFVALGGPAAHLLLAAGTFVPIFLLLPRIDLLDLRDPVGVKSGLYAAWSVAAFILVFNLIPAFPLDGGRVLRAALAFRMGDVRATRAAVRAGQVIFALLFLLGLAGRGGGVLLGFLAVYMFFEAERELREVLHAGGVYNPEARNIYAAELGLRQDWSREATDRSGPGGKPGFFARWRTRRQLRKLQRATERHERLRAEVDRILDKVNREGLPALTAKEKKILKQASKEYREGRR